MTDTEKIMFILKESRLNNTQFSSKIGITAGALSGILTGRTKPTLPILRSVSQEFPQYNPMWLFDESCDDSKMYQNGDSAVPANTAVNVQSRQPSAVSSGEKAAMESLFNFDKDDEVVSQPAPRHNGYATTPPPSVTPPVQPDKREREAVAQVAKIDEEKIAMAVASKLQKAPRQIIEVRVFFDDGTFETFGPR